MLHQFAFLAIFLDLIADPGAPSMRDFADLPNPEAVILVVAAIIALVCVVAVITIVALHHIEERKEDDK